MPFTHSQHALTPAVRAAGRTFSTFVLRSARSSGGRGACAATSLKAKPSHCSQALVQHRAKSSWHRPGCSWAAGATVGNSRSVPRDRDCPACQHEEKDPFDVAPHDLMMQQKRQMLEMRRSFERDPYEALFGMSNRRLNALWNSHFAFPDIKSMFQTRASLHSTSRSAASATGVRRTPVNNDEGDFRASVTWSHSGVDAKGKPFDKSGKLVYDPVSGKMVQSKDDVDHVSTTAAPATVVGQVVHQTIVQDGKSPEIKYARPSTDPAEIPEDSVTKSQQKMMEDIQAKEARFEAAKDRADSAIGVEQDAREYNFHDPAAKDDIIASGAPPRNINNEMGRLVNLEFDDLRTADKYVTPTADAPTQPGPEEKVRGSVKASMEQVMQREKELENAKQKADSAVGVEEDAARAGWTAESNPSRTVSSSQDPEPPTRRGHSTFPISNVNFPDSASSKFSSTAPSTTGNEEKMSSSSISSMDRIKAKEREFEAAKRNLNTFKVKQHEMESSWQREQEPRSGYKGDVRSTQSWPTPQQLDRQARLREEKQTKAKAWASFKNATPSKRYPDSQHELGVPESPAEPSSIASASRMAAEGFESPPRAGQSPSQWRSAATSEEASRGFMVDRTPGALSVFTRERPLKSMSLRDLDRDRANVMKSWTGKKATHGSEKEPTAAEAMLDREVRSQKDAMSWFENKWRQWRRHSGPSTTPEQPQSKTPSVETVAAEGDMAPNVADFATSERWYKNKAPHAFGAEEHRLQDAELVESLKGIYEQTYGSINKPQPSHGEKQSIPTVNAKKPSVHATLDNSSAPAEIDLALKESTRRDPGENFELRAYSRRTEDGETIAPMSPGKVNLLQLQQHKNNAPIQLAQALTQLRASSSFADYLIKNNKLDEQIVHAKGDVLVTRVPRPTTGHSPNELPASRSRANINPIDGTAALPNLTPQTGNFASPTGFVNHDIFSPADKRSGQSPRINSTMRKVRKEEPVFSGAIPQQRYSVPEIVTMFNEQGVGGSKSSSGNAGRSGASTGYEKDQRRKDWKFVRLFRKGLLITMLSGFTLANFYAIGVVIEYFRDGPTSANDSPTSSWDDRSYTRASTIGLWGSARNAEQKGKKKNEQVAPRVGYFEDMPLRGMEYPLLGILAACVWYLVCNGQ